MYIWFFNTTPQTVKYFIASSRVQNSYKFSQLGSFLDLRKSEHIFLITCNLIPFFLSADDSL